MEYGYEGGILITMKHETIRILRPLTMCILFILVLPVLHAECSATAGGRFPAMEIDNLNEETLKLPTIFDKRGTVLIMAFRREDSELSESWAKAIARSNLGRQDISFFSMIVLDDPGLLIRALITGGIRGGLSEEEREILLILFTDKEKFQRSLRVQNDELVVLLSDNTGKILHTECGTPDSQKVAAFRRKIEDE